MGKLQAFQLPGCRLWFHTGDHGPPHFHAAVVDAWEIRVFFLEQPPRHEVKFEVKHISTSTVRAILALAGAHRAELFEEWERSQGR